MFFFKHKTAYELRISDWSSDVCSSDLGVAPNLALLRNAWLQAGPWAGDEGIAVDMPWLKEALSAAIRHIDWKEAAADVARFLRPADLKSVDLWSERFFVAKVRSEEHTSELQSLMRISYAVYCLKKKKTQHSRNKL